jgi:small-conductance mechanosensitive channel
VNQLQSISAGDRLQLSGDSQAGEGSRAEGLDAARRVQETAQDVRHFTLRAIWAAILFLIAWLGIRGAVWVLNVLSERSAKHRLLFKKLIPIVRLVVWALTVFYVVSAVFEIDRAGLLAGTAALGVGIGFAAQGVLKNVFGGLIIIFDQPFQVGDKIRVAGTYVPGWIDVAKAKAIAMDAAINSQYTYLDKPVVVNVRDEFDRIFLTHLVVKAYVIDTRYEFALASDVTETAKAEFLRQGMIPSMPLDLETIDAMPTRPTAGSQHA